MLCRDADAARRVNLTNSDKPQDFYGDVIAHVWAELEADSNEWAAWWRHRLEPLQPRKLRKLIKTPAGTFAYNVTDYGMVEQINEVYRDTFKGNEPRSAAAYYLAKKIRGACEELLPGPNRVMRYIHKLARFRTAEGDFLRWVSPTGFPVCNRYQKPNYKTVYLPGGIEHEVADGCLPIIREKKARNAAAPNFVHSLDAAHLIRTVNAAVSERIINVLCVHDAYCCLAPQAQRFNTIIRRELGVMHAYYDGLHRLRNWNVNADVFPLPPYGDLNPLDIQHPETYAEYSFS